MTGQTINPEQITDDDAEVILTGVAETFGDTDGMTQLLRFSRASSPHEVVRAGRISVIRDSAAGGISRSKIAEASGMPFTSICRTIDYPQEGQTS